MGSSATIMVWWGIINVSKIDKYLIVWTCIRWRLTLNEELANRSWDWFKWLVLLIILLYNLILLISHLALFIKYVHLLIQLILLLFNQSFLLLPFIHDRTTILFLLYVISHQLFILILTFIITKTSLLRPKVHLLFFTLRLLGLS